MSLPGRLEFEPKFLRLEVRGTGDDCPGHLFLQVVRVCVAANADGTFGGPMSWFVVQILEFEGHLIRVRVDPVDVGVDACSELLKHLFGTRTVDLPLFFHCTAVEKQAGGLVLLHIRRTEHFRELSEPTPVPDINLKQSIPRDVEALCKKQISLVLRVDVRHAPVVDQNLNWLSEVRQRNRLRCDRLSLSREGWNHDDTDYDHQDPQWQARRSGSGYGFSQTRLAHGRSFRVPFHPGNPSSKNRAKSVATGPAASCLIISET